MENANYKLQTGASVTVTYILESALCFIVYIIDVIN